MACYINEHRFIDCKECQYNHPPQHNHPCIMEEHEHHITKYIEDALLIVPERVVTAFYEFYRVSFPVLDFEVYKNANRHF